MHGYMGNVLLVNLTDGTHSIEPLSEDWCRDYIGGEGLGVRLFHDLHKPGATPLDADQPLIFATGPLTGTSAPSSGRMCVVFRSPATETLGISNVGGYFAPELKKAGYELLAITGKAEKPVALYINDDTVEIRDASALWGKDIAATEEALKKDIDLKKLQICSIGQAGENLVNYASIMSDTERAAGRGGGGAVMGSKNLKALVVKGSKPLTPSPSASSTPKPTMKSWMSNATPASGALLPVAARQRSRKALTRARMVVARNMKPWVPLVPNV